LARPADEIDAHPVDDGCLVGVGGRHEQPVAVLGHSL
jgi:hypothetical protein